VLNDTGNRRSHYEILWDQIELDPVCQIKDGVLRRAYQLPLVESRRRGHLLFRNELLELEGHWSDREGFGCRLTFTLKNVSESSIRLTRLVFPAENGLESWLRNFPVKNITFLRNGYQSWSTARSYRLDERPLRPWLKLVSLANSNLANLPSNLPGVFSSDMFALFTNPDSGDSFLVGQGAPFSQFFYIKLNLSEENQKRSYFEITYDFGRKMISPGARIDLDGIIMARGPGQELYAGYMERVRERMELPRPQKTVRGWSSWYFYFNRITPEILLENLKALGARNLAQGVFQIDDGYQTGVGDWLRLRPEFAGRMPELARAIREAGMRPGLWLAPFVASRKSELARIHPDYLLRNEKGAKLVAGYNLFWPGKLYYGLDVTHPRFEEYLRRVIDTIVHNWGFDYLKCDFLFGACLRGGTHHDLTLSRAEVLKRGMSILRDQAGPEAFIVGCGMPLSAGVGSVDAMRVGPDTGPYWIEKKGRLLRTGAMVGVRNSVRNTLVRSAMHGRLWTNDPDCLMMRGTRTKLSGDERFTQINAVILAGAMLLFSDEVAALTQNDVVLLERIIRLHDNCITGDCIALDLMEREIPELIYNTAGYIGVFNAESKRREATVHLSRLSGLAPPPQQLADVWNGETFAVSGDEQVKLGVLQPHSSRLLEVVTERLG